MNRIGGKKWLNQIPQGRIVLLSDEVERMAVLTTVPIEIDDTSFEGAVVQLSQTTTKFKVGEYRKNWKTKDFELDAARLPVVCSVEEMQLIRKHRGLM